MYTTMVFCVKVLIYLSSIQPSLFKVDSHTKCLPCHRVPAILQSLIVSLLDNTSQMHMYDVSLHPLGPTDSDLSPVVSLVE